MPLPEDDVGTAVCDKIVRMCFEGDTLHMNSTDSNKHME